MDAIKRYSPALQHAGGCTLPCMYPLADGEYVRFDDHVAVVAALEARLAEAEKARDEAVSALRLRKHLDDLASQSEAWPEWKLNLLGGAE